MGNRELDLQVAVKVMGWKIVGGSAYGPNGEKYAALDDRGQPLVWKDDGSPRWLPHYSSSIDSAWEVVRHIADRLPNITLSPRLDAEYVALRLCVQCLDACEETTSPPLVATKTVNAVFRRVDPLTPPTF